VAEENSIDLRRGLAGEFITRSAEETFDLGMRIGESLSNRAIILLSGDLGAGKTVLAKGIASGLGIDPADVTSPSFTLINVYEGRLRLYHVDLYRLDAGACRELGLEEIFEEQSAIAVIEWAERLGLAPAEAIQIRIEYLSDSERKIIISGFADQASFDA
jgi:tRNA threonylcarbamoyladenosine biosynthesis protein TsaE